MISVTKELTWLDALAESHLWVPPAIPTLVISPHPDDETLGAGGLIAFQSRRGVPVTVIAVTDGEAAYADTEGLGDIREEEQTAALAELGVGPERIARLRLPDSNVTPHEDRLVESVRPYVTPGSLLVAPWPSDPHPDHEACGRAAARLSQIAGATIIFYLFWTWHRSEASSLSGLTLGRLQLDDTLRQARTRALSQHQSQLRWPGGNPILPQHLLAPAQRDFETFILHA